MSSGGKTKSPALKKNIGKLELGSKSGTADIKPKTTITPKNSSKKGILQISVSVLTDELLTGRATGEYKTKGFQKLMGRINQKIQVCNLLLNKSALELKEPKNDFYSTILPSISEKENIGIEMEKHMDLKSIKSNLVDPVCESLEKLAKSKYIVKISEREGAQVFSKLIKAIKAMIDEPIDSWLEDDDRKDQRSYKVMLVKSMVENISAISKNDKIRNSQMEDDDTIDTLIDLFLWANRNNKNENIKKIYDKLIDIICTIVNIKSNKYFIPSAFVQEMEKIKRKTISHGLLSLLFNIYEDENTESIVKKQVYTKVLLNVEQQDIKDAIEVLKSVISKDFSDHKEGKQHTVTL